MKKTLYSGLFLASAVLLSTPFLASAQTYGNQYNYTTTNSCLTLTQYEALGARDIYTNGQVSMLQQFLNNTGYLRGVTGTYDQGTFGAVVNYQREHGISATGTVGPLTRAAINAQSCNGSYSNSNGNNGYNGYNTISISSLSSTSGYAGSSVTIYGTNLLMNNSVVHFGGSTISVSYSSNNSLTFTVPSLSNGTYQVYVSNANGTSNSLSYTITGSSGNNCYSYNSYNSYNSNCSCSNSNYYNNGYSYSNCGSNSNSNSGTWYGGGSQPSISGISGLTSPSTGSTYTWTASAYSQNNLSYTVRAEWGDGTSQQSSSASYNTTQQQSYPFTHMYTNTGSYTIRFTTTDSSGAFAYATLPISVSGSNGYNNYNNNNGYTPSISYLSQTNAMRGTTITIYGSNFTSNNTVLSVAQHTA
jgi:hypothetical protein